MSAFPPFNEIRSVSKRCAGAAIFSFLLVLLLPGRGEAAQEQYPLDLTWEAPSSCPQLDEVEEQIRTLVSGLTEGEWQSSMRARGTITPSAQRFELTLVIQQGQTAGKRVIASDDCQSLGKAAAVVLGLLIRKEQRLGRELSAQEISGDTDSTHPPPGGASQPQRPTPESALTPSKRPAPTATTHASASVAALFGPNLTLDSGTLPDASYGIGLAAGVFVGRLHLMAAGNFWPAQSVHPLEGRAIQASFRRQSAEATGCYAWSIHRAFAIGPCVQLALDRITAQASGGRVMSRSGSSLIFAAGAGLGAFLRLGESVAVAVTAVGRAATHRPTFVLDTPFGKEGVHTVPALSALTSLGCVWIF